MAEWSDKYFRVVKGSVARSWRNFELYLDYVFNAVAFEGRSMLDVGGGNGLLSFYAASRGAREVVCLEPESAGHDPACARQFDELREALPEGGCVRRIPLTIQKFEAADSAFDIILFNNAVSHLDEEASRILGKSEAARERYRIIFRKLARMTAKGGDLVIVESSRYNFFGLIGLRNPLVPAVRWKDHQPPGVWIRLLEQCGFRSPRLSWRPVNRWGAPGRLLLSNRAGAFFMTGEFRLAMRRE